MSDTQEMDLSGAVAVVGIACNFPGGRDTTEFWNTLMEGANMIREVPPERWNADAFYDADVDKPGKAYSKQGGFIDG